MKTCPVCGEDLIQDQLDDYLDGRILLESEWKCPNGHYMYQFMTGYYAEWIEPWPEPALTWSYASGPTQQERFRYECIIRMAKKRWRYAKV